MLILAASMPVAATLAQETAVAPQPNISETTSTVAPEKATGALGARTSKKPAVLGHTYVSLASGLESVFRGNSPQNLEELKLLEVQQSLVAEAIEEVTVNVQQGSAQGSGVIINAQGYILTAAHVAGKPGLVATIVLSDGTKLAGRTLGVNRNKDAGLVKIVEQREEPWPFATPGRSSELRVGEWVIASGHPGGFKQSRGSVIRVGRVHKIGIERNGLAHTLFTDCALIGGDSGGPLFSLRGELVGIHSRIGTDVGENMHVPIDVYSDDWDRLANGEAWGVLPGYKAVIGIKGESNGSAKIASVTNKGPAQRAGVMRGDVIVSINGTPIRIFADIQKLVDESTPGEVLQIEIMRGSQRLRLHVAVGVAERHG